MTQVTDDTGPAAVFLRQVSTFNAGDLEGFIACYSNDAVIQSSDGSAQRGLSAIRDRYAERLSAPGLHCEVEEFIELSGGWVVARELVGTPSSMAYVTASFAIRDGQIIYASLSRDADLPASSST